MDCIIALKLKFSPLMGFLSYSNKTFLVWKYYFHLLNTFKAINRNNIIKNQ